MKLHNITLLSHFYHPLSYILVVNVLGHNHFQINLRSLLKNKENSSVFHNFPEKRFNYVLVH